MDFSFAASAAALAKEHVYRQFVAILPEFRGSFA